MSRREEEAKVKSWGFPHVFTWTDGPYVSIQLFRPLTLMKYPRVHASIIHCRSIDMPTRNAHYTPHTHNGLTTHLILDGELTITYPEDKNPTKETFGVGSRIDVDAGRVHEVWVGKAGCTYVIGEK